MGALPFPTMVCLYDNLPIAPEVPIPFLDNLLSDPSLPVQRVGVYTFEKARKKARSSYKAKKRGRGEVCRELNDAF